MVDDDAFRKTIADNPREDAPKLVYADFLEEHGEVVRAKFLREQCAMASVPTFSEDQAHVVGEIKTWMASPDSAYLTLGGYAGTGKSTIMSHLAQLWPNAAIAALCGKAANVLRSKGIHRAQTIHSLMYHAVTEPGGRVRFELRDGLEVLGGGRADRILIDEASMVGQRLLDDLLSFDLPILFVGDHGQLEPIDRDAGLMRQPQLTLTKIHRQAMDNPIIRLSIAFREGRAVSAWKDKMGRVEIVPADPEFWGRVSPNWTVLCGRNATRHEINRHVRQALGYKSPYPVPGDQLLCLRNNKRFGIFNGQRCVCLKSRSKGDFLNLELETEDGRLSTIPCLKAQFGTDTIDLRDDGLALFDYGYGLTVHRAQGSEFENVLVVEEIMSNWNAARWRYTAVTRAKDRLVYCF